MFAKLIPLVSLLLGLVSPGAASAAPRNSIRVGGPSAPGDTKIAIVLSGLSNVGHKFQVLSGKTLVLSGKLTKATGSPSPWGSAAEADLSSIRTRGSYVVQVGSVKSPPWVVTSDPWHALIGRLERIYQVNADGNEPNPVFGPSHLNDSTAPIKGGPTNGGTVYVSGGWRDAGDAIKFTTTIGISSVILDYVAGLDRLDASSLSSLSDIGVRYVEKAHPQGSQTFIAQVGDGTDHEVVNGTFARNYALDDSSSNPAFSHRIAYGDAGSGTLGAAAAALASGAIRYGVSTPAGSQALQLATEWYARGKAVSGPGPLLGGFEQPGINSGDWQGYMALAATELWRAGAGDSYLTDVGQYLPQAQVDQGFSPYFDVGALAAADLCGGLGRPAVTDQSVRDQACTVLRNVGSLAAGRAASQAFGWPATFNWGAIQDAMAGAAFAAAGQRAGVFSGGHKIAETARDYLLGRNPWNASFVMGAAPTEAHSPQHSIVIMGNPSTLGNGFVVGGPAPLSSLTNQRLKLDSCQKTGTKSRYEQFNPTYNRQKIVYEDCQNDYVTSEPGLAYSDGALLLMGELAAGG